MEIQRARLLAAAVCTVEELGYGGASVAHITRRARISRRTFYELFAGREECLLALIDDTIAKVRAELDAGELAALPWRERLRAGLWSVLRFFDGQPALARVCFVEAPRGGLLVIGRREEVLATLATIVDDGRYESSRAAGRPSLTAEGLVGAAFTIIHSRLLNGGREPLVNLHGTLMAMLVLPYLGPAAARQEQERAAPASPSGRSVAALDDGQSQYDPFVGLAMRMTYRTAKVLQCAGEHPGASNRELGEHAGIQDAGQVSKLLARLQGLGLLANDSRGHAKGEPNAWTLTTEGTRLARRISVSAAPQQTASSELEKGRP